MAVADMVFVSFLGDQKVFCLFPCSSSRLFKIAHIVSNFTPGENPFVATAKQPSRLFGFLLTAFAG